MAKLTKAQAVNLLRKLVAEGGVLPRVHPKVLEQTALASWRLRATATVQAILPAKHRLFSSFAGIEHMLSHSVEHFIGGLAGLAEAIESGLLDELEAEIVERISADDLDVAQEAFDSSGTNLSFVAAAVLAGATLEKALRRKCEGLGIGILKPNGDRKAMSNLIDALRAANEISSLRERQMRCCGALKIDQEMAVLRTEN